MAKLLHIFYHKEGTFSLLCQQVQLITVSSNRQISKTQRIILTLNYFQHLLHIHWNGFLLFIPCVSNTLRMKPAKKSQ